MFTIFLLITLPNGDVSLYRNDSPMPRAIFVPITSHETTLGERHCLSNQTEFYLTNNNKLAVWKIIFVRWFQTNTVQVSVNGNPQETKQVSVADKSQLWYWVIDCLYFVTCYGQTIDARCVRIISIQINVCQFKFFLQAHLSGSFS